MSEQAMEAIAAIDQLWADRPDKVGQHFSEATRCLAAWRDALVRSRERKALDQVNAAISVILGGQFPLGHVPWQEIASARQQLRKLLQDAADQLARPDGNSSQTTRS